METTKEEKNRLLIQLDKMAWGAAHRCGSKNTEDINDVHNQCLMSISRSIDDFDETMGATMSGLAFRYSEQTRRNWYKMNVSDRFAGKQRRMENSVSELNEELTADTGDSLSALSLSIVFDRAEIEGIITKRMYDIFVYRLSGLSREAIGEKIGLKESRVGQIERDGIRRIREAYEGKL